MKLQSILLFVAIVILSACQKENLIEEEINQIQETTRTTKAILSTPDFDWENPSTYKYKYGNSVYVCSSPFHFAHTTLPNHVQLDMRSNDGWEMLYNCFFPESTPNNLVTNSYTTTPYLVLYNKYKGIMRFFIWTHDRNHNGLSHGIATDTQNSLFNFMSTFSNPISDEIDKPVVKQANFGSGQEVFPNNWIYFDYEIAFDPNASEEQTFFNFKSWGSNTQYLNLSGTQTGSIKGTITLSGKGGLASGLLDIGNLVMGNSNISNITQNLGKDNIVEEVEKNLSDQINEGIKEGAKKAAKDWTSDLGDLLSSPLTKLTNSLIGDNMSLKGDIDLNLKTQINLNGTITEEKPLLATKFLVPGSILNSGTLNVTLPNYNKPLGVFNLSEAPTVYWDEYFFPRERSRGMEMESPMGRIPGRSEYYYAKKLKFNAAEIKNLIVINDAAEIDHYDVSFEMVYHEKYEHHPGSRLFLYYNNNWDGNDEVNIDMLERSYNVNNSRENIWHSPRYNLNYMWFIDKDLGYYTPWRMSSSLWANGQLSFDNPEICIKVKIKLFPKNSSKEIIMVKTFKPKFVRKNHDPLKYVN